MGAGGAPAGPPRPPYGGRHRTIPDRNCFVAVVFMALTSTPGGCYPPRNSAAAHQRRYGAASASGRRPGRSVRSPYGLGPVGKRRSAGLVAGERGHHERARQAWGSTWAQIRSIVASLGPSSAWSATVAGCPDRGGHRCQRGRHHHVPVPAGRRPAGADAVGAAALPARQGPRRQGVRPRGQPRLSAAPWGSPRGSPGAQWSPRRGLGGTGGRSSGRCRG
jgi:hypothetical protein